MPQKTQKLTLLLFLIVLIAITVGYLISNLQNKNAQPLAVAEDSSSELTKEQKEQQKLIDAAQYTFSYPSNGAIVRTQGITLTYHDNGWVSSKIPVGSEKDLKVNQDVILYDKEGTTMPLGGNIRLIRPKDNQIELIIEIPSGTKTKLLSNDAEVIVLEALASQRFPLSALQRDKNDNTFVWAVKATDEENKFQAIKTWVDRPFLGDNYFVAGKPIRASSLVILNPNKKIKNKKIYKMAQVEFKAPTKSPIKQAYYDYQNYVVEKILIDAKERARNCGEGGTSKLIPKPEETSACGQAGDIKKQSADEIFQSILSRQPGGGMSLRKNCGGGGAGCGQQPPPAAKDATN